MSLVVYTAVTQGYDILRPVAETLRGGGRFVAYVESPQVCAPWEIKSLEPRFGDPVRDAKAYKILPQVYLPDSQFSLWIDGKMEPLVPVENLLEFLEDAHLVVFEHALRCCLYDEACQCIHQKMDDTMLMYRQIQRYTREGFPANYGLADCAVLLRRHSPKMAAFSQLWWEEIQSGSRRDQLSFMYCVWKTGIKVRYFSGFTHQNPLFRMHPHLKPFPRSERPTDILFQDRK